MESKINQMTAIPHSSSIIETKVEDKNLGVKINEIRTGSKFVNDYQNTQNLNEISTKDNSKINFKEYSNIVMSNNVQNINNIQNFSEKDNKESKEAKIFGNEINTNTNGENKENINEKNNSTISEEFKVKDIEENSKIFKDYLISYRNRCETMIRNIQRRQEKKEKQKKIEEYNKQIEQLLQRQTIKCPVKKESSKKSKFSEILSNFKNVNTQEKNAINLTKSLYNIKKEKIGHEQFKEKEKNKITIIPAIRKLSKEKEKKKYIKDILNMNNTINSPRKSCSKCCKTSNILIDLMQNEQRNSKQKKGRSQKIILKKNDINSILFKKINEIIELFNYKVKIENKKSIKPKISHENFLQKKRTKRTKTKMLNKGTQTPSYLSSNCNCYNNMISNKMIISNLVEEYSYQVVFDSLMKYFFPNNNYDYNEKVLKKLQKLIKNIGYNKILSYIISIGNLRGDLIRSNKDFNNIQVKEEEECETEKCIGIEIECGRVNKNRENIGIKKEN